MEELQISDDIAQSVERAEMWVDVIRCGCGLTEYEPNHICPNPIITEKMLVGVYEKHKEVI